MFHMGSQMQQLSLSLFVADEAILGGGVNGFHCEFALSESTRFVEYHRTDFRQHVHIVRTLDEDAFA